MIEVEYVLDMRDADRGMCEYVEQKEMPLVGEMVSFNDSVLSEFVGTWVVSHVNYGIGDGGMVSNCVALLISCEQALEERNKREYYGEEEAGAAADPDDGSTT